MKYLLTIITLFIASLGGAVAQAKLPYPRDYVYTSDGAAWLAVLGDHLERAPDSERAVVVQTWVGDSLRLEVRGDHLGGIVRQTSCTMAAGWVYGSWQEASDLQSWSLGGLTLFAKDLDADPELQRPPVIADPVPGGRLDVHALANGYTSECATFASWSPAWAELRKLQDGLAYTIERATDHSTRTEFKPVPQPGFLEWLVGLPEPHVPLDLLPYRLAEWRIGEAGLSLRGVVEDEHHFPTDLWMVAPRVSQRVGYERDIRTLPFEEARTPRETANIHIAWYDDVPEPFEVWGEIDGMRDGLYAAFDTSGNLLVSGTYILGTRHGLFLYFGWRDNGATLTLVAADTYVMGTRTGRWEAPTDFALPVCGISVRDLYGTGPVPPECEWFRFH